MQLKFSRNLRIVVFVVLAYKVRFYGRNLHIKLMED